MSLISSLIKIFVGDKAKKDMKEIAPLVEQINAHQREYKSLSNDELRAKTIAFKERIAAARSEYEQKIQHFKEQADATDDIEQKEDFYSEIDKLTDEAYKAGEKVLNEILPEAFAVVKETAQRFVDNPTLEVTATPFDRELASQKDYVSIEGDKAFWKNSWDAAGKAITWDMVHYDVQLIGGIALHPGKIAEMQTGEGKTLVATLPLYLNALTGNGVHLVTVNDYLARRDSAWMAPLFQFHGLRVECIDNYQPNSAGRRMAYAADITYGTNNEFGFDYLRDNMAHTPDELVQRPHNHAIVDEVDSVLIDDARTPLIISGPMPRGEFHEFDVFKPAVEALVEKQRKHLTNVLAEAKKLISEGNTKEGGVLLLRVHRGLPKNKALIKFLSEEGMKQLLQKTENYYMQDNNREMHKIDEDLLFVINEKNNQIELTDKGINEMSQGEDKNFFVMPDIGAEIANIEKQNLSKEEENALKDKLYQEFGEKSERIHTVNQLLKAYTLFEKDIEYVVIDNKVLIVDEQTGRIMDGRRYSDGLHQAIEAKENVQVEAATQTYATITLQNYFRMYRKLSGMTGTATTEAGEFWEIYKLDVMEIPTNRPIARKDQNDQIYRTKREKYNAVIEEVVSLSQAGRPVLIGTTSVEVSELLSRMLKLRNIPHNVLNAKLHKKEAEIVAEAGKKGVVTIATNMAGRGTDIKLTDEVKAAGGLAIIGTERHDSRRVDRQLRGRSGRQGDPGSSKFFVSFEDNLMRLYGMERAIKFLDRLGQGLKEGEVLEHPIITKNVEKAQKKVEENNFGIRKRLLEYDDVMNAQREVIYKRRRHALYGERLQVDIANIIYDTLETILESNKPGNDYKNFEYEHFKYFGIQPIVSEEEFHKKSLKDLIKLLYPELLTLYKAHCETNATIAYPVIKQVYEDPNNQFERIVVPFTDGQKGLNIATDLKEAYESGGKQIIIDFEKNISLAIIDDAWKTHLRQMDELKQSVQLATHEQKDPLLIYKFEAYNLFKDMVDRVNKEIVAFLFHAHLPQAEPAIEQAHEVKRAPEQLQTSKEEVLNSDELAQRNREAGQQASPAPQVTEPIVRDQPKIGRNDKVTIQNIRNGEIKEMKYKQAIPFLEKGDWVLKR